MIYESRLIDAGGAGLNVNEVQRTIDRCYKKLGSGSTAITEMDGTTKNGMKVNLVVTMGFATSTNTASTGICEVAIYVENKEGYIRKGITNLKGGKNGAQAVVNKAEALSKQLAKHGY